MKGTYRFDEKTVDRANEMIKKGETITEPGLLERMGRGERFVVIEQLDK